MSLKKLALTTYTPGTPGVPGDPGEPAHPAYQIVQFVTPPISAGGFSPSVTQTQIFDWEPVHLYRKGNFVRSIGRVPISTGLYFEAEAVSGNSGFAEPNWKTAIGSRTTDNAQVWITRGSTQGQTANLPPVGGIKVPNQGIFVDVPYNPLTHEPAHRVFIPGTVYTPVSFTPQVINVPASAGRPAIPGIPATQGQWNIDHQIGFNAGAWSVKRLDGDVQTTFKIIQAAGIFVGFTNEDPRQGYKRMSHSLYFRDFVVQVREFGVQVGPSSSFTRNNLFAIERTNGRITYLRDGVRIFTSATISSGSLVIDTDLYSAGDTVE